MIYKNIPKSSGIYCIKNNVNRRVYIGSSADIRARCQKHFWYLRNNNHPSQLLQNAYNKHGEENFSIQALELCDREELVTREQYWINKYESCGVRGYNLSPVAYSCRGVKRSAETRSKMSAAHKGKIITIETRAKMAAANKGLRHSDETRAKMTAARKGHIVSEDTRAKLSAIFTGRKMSEQSRDKMSAARKGMTPHNKGKKASDEDRAKMREGWERRKQRIAEEKVNQPPHP